MNLFFLFLGCLVGYFVGAHFYWWVNLIVIVLTIMILSGINRVREIEGILFYYFFTIPIVAGMWSGMLIGNIVWLAYHFDVADVGNTIRWFFHP